MPIYTIITKSHAGLLIWEKSCEINRLHLLVLARQIYPLYPYPQLNSLIVFIPGCTTQLARISRHRLYWWFSHCRNQDKSGAESHFWCELNGHVPGLPITHRWTEHTYGAAAWLWCKFLVWFCYAILYDVLMCIDVRYEFTMLSRWSCPPRCFSPRKLKTTYYLKLP